MMRIAQLKQFLTESPQDPFLHYALTMEYVKLGDESEAMKHFEHMVDVFPDYVGTYYHFGKFLEKQGDKARAESVYKTGMEVASAKRNFHALGELRGALNLLQGLDDDDD